MNKILNIYTYIYSRCKSPVRCHLQTFFLVYSLYFYSNSVFCREKGFNFDEVQFIIVFVLWTFLGILVKY